MWFCLYNKAGNKHKKLSLNLSHPSDLHPVILIHLVAILDEERKLTEIFILTRHFGDQKVL